MTTENKTIIDLMREYVRVADMCKGTPLEDNPWECIKFGGTVLSHMPNFAYINDRDATNYSAALAILEGRPVFRGDRLYGKNSPVEILATEGHIWHLYTWTPPAPKRTFMLNGVELPCPLKNPEINEVHNIDMVVIGSTQFYFKNIMDREMWFMHLEKLLTEARDKE